MDGTKDLDINMVKRIPKDRVLTSLSKSASYKQFSPNSSCPPN